MSIKIIHCADIHFDAVMSSMADAKKINIRREDMKKTFRKIIALAASSDLLLISGDLFDGKKVSKATLEFIKSEFSKIPETKIFIIAGNHDYMSDESPYKTFDFGENVHIFGTEMECVELHSCDVYGVSFKSPDDEREMLKEVKLKTPEKLNICLIHGNVGGADYSPIKVSDIEKSGLDYLALGHIHKSIGIKQASKTYYAYPGCPEGHGFDETGEKGVYSVEIEKGGIIKQEFIPTSTRMYFDEEVDISGAETFDDIYEKINEKHKGDEHIYRFTLKGSSNILVDTAVIKENIAGFSVTLVDKCTPSVDLEKLSGEFSLKGLFAKMALADRESMTEEEFNAAIKAGLYYIEKEENNEN